MDLSTWKHAPHGKILKSDVTVAKNYLSEEHVKELNRIVSAYLDLAENRAKRGDGRPIYKGRRRARRFAGVLASAAATAAGGSSHRT